MEELLYSYIRHMEGLATDLRGNTDLCDTDYEQVIAEHRLFASRIAASKDFPQSIKDQCAALQLPRRPTHMKNWHDVLRLLEWIVGRIPDRFGDRNPHVFYKDMLNEYIEDLRALRQTAFFTFNKIT